MECLLLLQYLIVAIVRATPREATGSDRAESVSESDKLEKQEVCHEEQASEPC
jgi:hypothetical protein